MIGHWANCLSRIAKTNLDTTLSIFLAPIFFLNLVQKMQFRFSSRQFFVVVFVIAVLIGAAPRLYRVAINYSPVNSKDQFPNELAQLLDNNSQVTGFRWYEGFSLRSILLIENDKKLVREFIKKNNLKPSGRKHPLAVRMTNAIPREWQWPYPEDGRWYKSPKNAGIEILVHTTRGRDSAIIYHVKNL